jgi:hypothetical protein
MSDETPAGVPESYLNAIAFFHAQPTERNAEALRALIRLFPNASVLSKS